MNKLEIIKLLKKHKTTLREYGVVRIGLFGSFLKGNSSLNSDIDLLVHFKNPNFDSYMQVYYFLQKITGRNVDLVIESDVKPEMKYVLKEAYYVKV